MPNFRDCHQSTLIQQDTTILQADYSNIIFVHGLFGNPKKTWTGYLPNSKSHQARLQPDNEQLADLLHTLASHVDGIYVKIKLCLASRPWDTFTVSFGSCPGFKVHEHTANDIRRYTLSKLNQASPKSHETSTENLRLARLEILARQVTEKAHGVFIWVRIVVDEIAKGVRERVPLSMLEEKLSKMPEELKDLYEHTLERIETEHVEEAYVMLQIARCAISPLTLEAFVNATSYTLWSVVPPAGEETEEDMRQRVISRSGGLLEISEEISDKDGSSGSMQSPGTHLTASETSSLDQKPRLLVQFLHQTVKEYIQGRDDNFGLTHAQSGGCGFQYLLNVGIRCWVAWADDIGVQIFEYARLFQSTAVYEVRHLENKLALLADPPKFAPVGRELIPSRIEWWIGWKRQTSKDFGDYYYHHMRLMDLDKQVLCLALAAGLFEVVTRIHATLTETKKNSVTRELMTMAVLGPQTTSKLVPRRQMLGILFKLEGQADYRLGWKFNLTSTLALVINFAGKYGQDEGERRSAIEFLLEAGADPNASGLDLESIFSKCVKRESAEVVRIFREYEATLPADSVETQLWLWRSLRRPSDVLKEVIEIFERKYYPGVGRSPLSVLVLGLVSEQAPKSISALMAVGALTTMGHGAGWIFRRCLTAKERWRFAINRTMWLRKHRVRPASHLKTFEDVVFLAMAHYTLVSNNIQSLGDHSHSTRFITRAPTPESWRVRLFED